MATGIDEFVLFFDSDFEEVVDMIFNVAVFSLEPEKESCKTIESGLRKLAEYENKNACAVYAIITAYNNCCECFSESFALECVFKNKTLELYHEMAEKYFREIVDEEFFSSLYSAPAMWLLEHIAKGEE